MIGPPNPFIVLPLSQNRWRNFGRNLDDFILISLRNSRRVDSDLRLLPPFERLNNDGGRRRTNILAKTIEIG